MIWGKWKQQKVQIEKRFIGEYIINEAIAGSVSKENGIAGEEYFNQWGNVQDSFDFLLSPPFPPPPNLPPLLLLLLLPLFFLLFLLLQKGVMEKAA